MTLDKVQLAIGHMIAELPPLASLSIKRGDRFWDIRVEIKPEAEPAPDTKKKKPSPSRLRRNQRRLRMLLERSKTTGPEEPDLAGTKVTDAGELPVSTGVVLTPVSQPDGPALSTLKTREDVNTQIPSPTPNSEGEGTDDDSQDDDSNSKEDGRDVEEDDSPEEEAEEERWCNKCTKDIIGIIHHCNTCEDGDFDLCTICYKKEGHMHPMSTLKARADVNTQIPYPTPNSEGEGTDDDSHDSNSKEDGRDVEEEEPTTRSPSVTSTSLPSMDVATMDMTPKDAVLNMQANKAIRVPANVVDNTVKTRSYVTVKRKARKKHDPNSCKTV